jgi:hypothetical protein
LGRAGHFIGEHVEVGSQALALFLRMTAYPAATRDPDSFRAVARRVNLLNLLL